MSYLIKMKLKNMKLKNMKLKNYRCMRPSIKDYCRMLVGIISISVCLLTFSERTYATMPVIDYTAILQMLKEFEQLKEQYKMISNQYDQMKTQYSSITGLRGMGNWENSLDELKNKREWAASDWQSALKGMSGGNPERYQQLLDQYKSEHAAMNASDYAKGSDDGLSKSYQNEVETNQASATTTSYEFNDINQHLQTLYDLGQQIENQKNKDLKASMDLNSRVQLEVGYISTEELRMQTILNQQMAELQSAKIETENEASQFNQAGENP